MSCPFSDGIEHQSETAEESSSRRITIAKLSQRRASSTTTSLYSADVFSLNHLETIDDPMTRSFYSSADSEGHQSEPEVPSGFQTLDDNCNEATMELVVFPKVNNKLILPDVGEISAPVNYQNHVTPRTQSLNAHSPSSQANSSPHTQDFCFDAFDVLSDVASGSDTSVYRINQGLYSIICKKVDLECNFCSSSFDEFSKLALHLQSHLDYDHD